MQSVLRISDQFHHEYMAQTTVHEFKPRTPALRVLAFGKLSYIKPVATTETVGSTLRLHPALD
jgi:hypothetical protein